MAVVSFTDADGVERWADEHSKAYEKHLKSLPDVAEKALKIETSMADSDVEDEEPEADGGA